MFDCQEKVKLISHKHCQGLQHQQQLLVACKTPGMCHQAATCVLLFAAATCCIAAHSDQHPALKQAQVILGICKYVHDRLEVYSHT